VFGLPEVPNLGFIPGSGGISRFTRLVGPHWARYVVMAGKNIDAETARTIGFVHEIYPAEGFAERVQAFARDLAALPGEAVGVAKLAIDAAASVDRVTARDFDRVASTMLLRSEDHQDRVAALPSRNKTGARPDPT
jgi:enoyl-CoA hydratase/carnithine racemase